MAAPASSEVAELAVAIGDPFKDGAAPRTEPIPASAASLGMATFVESSLAFVQTAAPNQNCFTRDQTDLAQAGKLAAR